MGLRLKEVMRGIEHTDVRAKEMIFLWPYSFSIA